MPPPDRSWREPACLGIARPGERWTVTNDSSSGNVAGGDGRGGASEDVPGRASPGVHVRTSLTRPWTTVISLTGAHDLSTAPTLERRAVEHLARCDRLVVDLTHASFFDSSIVNTLVRLGRQARPRGVTFQVVAVDGSHPHRVLSLMGLLGHLGCVGTLPETQTGQATRAADRPLPRA